MAEPAELDAAVPTPVVDIVIEETFLPVPD
jgi:hypothetical protein